MDVTGNEWGLNHLEGISTVRNARTRSVSAENPTGEKGRGAMAVPNPSEPDQPHSFLTLHLGRDGRRVPF